MVGALVAALAITSLGACGGAGTHASLLPRSGDLVALEREAERRLTQEGGSPEIYAQLAQIRLEQERPLAARGYVRRALALDARHPGALTVAARIASARGSAAQAVELYGQAHRSDPRVVDAIAKEWADALVAHARISLEAGRTTDALEALSRIDAALPQQLSATREARAELYLDVADAYLSQGRAQLAKEALESARNAGADSGRLRFLVARAAALGGDAAAGKLAFEAWANSSDSAKRWTQVGEFYASRQEGELAMWAFEKAVAADPPDAETWSRLAALALKSQEPDAAVRALGEAARGARTSDEKAARLAEGAESMRRTGYRTQALALFDEAAKLAPANWDVIHDYTDYLVEIGRPQLLESVCARYVEASGGSAEASIKAAQQLARGSRVDAGLALLEAAIGKPDASHEAWLALAELRDRKSDVPGRDAALDQLVARVGAKGTGPEAVAGLVAVGRAWLRYKKDVKALEMAREAVRLGPADVEATLLLADVHHLRRDVGRERLVLERFMQAAKDAPRAALRIGVRYADLNEPRRAEGWLTQALVSNDEAVRRQAHESLFEIYLGKRVRNFNKAAQHLRAWLSLTEREARVDALESVARRTLGISKLSDLRAEVLEELVERQPDRLTNLDELGRAYFRQGRYARARDVFERYVRIAEDRDKAIERIGQDFLAKARYDEAAYFFRLLTPEQIQHQRLHRQLGGLFARVGMPERAETHNRMYFEYARGSTSEFRHMKSFGRDMLSSHQLDMAVRAYRAVLERDPRDQEAALDLARAYLRDKDVARARRVLDRLLEDAAQRQRMLERVGELYKSEGALREAARVFEERLSRERPSWRLGSYNKLAEIFRRLGDREGLMRATRMMIKRARSVGRAYTMAAEQLEAAGMVKEAQQLLDELMAKRSGQTVQVVQAAAKNALKRGDSAAALKLFTKFIQMRGSRAEVWQEVAQTLSDYGYVDEAIEVLEGAVAKGLVGSDVYIARGRLFLMRGEVAKAHQDFVSALSGDAWRGQSLKEIEKAYAAAGEHERLLDIYTRAAAQGPARADHHLALARWHLTRGAIDEGRRSVLRYLGDNERGHLKVARAYAEAGFVEEALTHYERAYEHPSQVEAPEALRQVADLLLSEGRADDIERHLRRYVLTARNEAEAFKLVAEIYERTGHLDRAVDWLGRAAARQPDAKLHLQAGQILGSQGKHEEAWAAFARYVALEAERKDRRRPGMQRTELHPMEAATAEVTRYYLSQLRLDDALRRVRTSRAEYGESAWLTLAEVRVLIERGEIPAALERMDEHGEGLGQARSVDVLSVVDALVDRQRLAEALTVLDQALVASWREDIAVRRLELRARLGDLDGVRQAAAEIVHAGAPQKYKEVGERLFQQGLPDLAERHLSEALARGARNHAADAARLLLHVQRQRGTLEPAERERIVAVARGVTEDMVDSHSIAAWVMKDEGQWAAARAAADRALALEPGSLDLLKIVVRASAGLGDEAGLLQRLDAFEPRGRSRRSVLLNVAGWLERMHQPRLALRVVERMTAIDQTSSQLRLRAVRLALMAGLDAAAAEHAAAYYREEPERGLALAEIYDAYLAEPAATEWLDKAAVKAPPLLARRSLLLARRALRAGQVDEAQKAIEAAIEAGPHSGELRLLSARILLAQPGQRAQAEAALSALAPLLEGGAASAQVLSTAAEAAWHAGQPQRAQELYGFYSDRFARRLRGQGLPERRRMARAAVAAGDVTGARRVLEDLWRFVGDREASKIAIMTGASALEDADAQLSPDAKARMAALIEELVERAARLGKVESFWVPSAWDVVAEVRGESSRAFEAALARPPAAVNAANNLAYKLALRGRELERALRLVRTAHARAGRYYPEILDTEAWVLHKMGRSKEALAVMERALVVSDDEAHGSPDDMAEPLFHYGEILLANGRRAEALVAFRNCAWRHGDPIHAQRCQERLER